MKNNFNTIIILILLSCIMLGDWIPSSFGIEEANVSIADLLEIDINKLYCDSVHLTTPTEPNNNKIKVSHLTKRASSGGPHSENDIVTLMNMNTCLAAEGLYELAHSSNRYVSGKAIWALGNMDKNLAVPLMIKLLDSKSVPVERKAVIISSLKDYSDAAIEEALIKQLKNIDIEQYALTALGDIGTKKSVDILHQYSKYGQGSSKSIAAHSIKLVEMRMDSNKVNEVKAYPYISYNNNDEGVHNLKEISRSYDNSTNMLNQLRAQIEKDICKIRAIEHKMNEIQDQVLQVDTVKDSVSVYNTKLAQRMKEVALSERWISNSLQNEQAEYLLKQEALKDANLVEATKSIRSMMLDEAHKIEPNIYKLESELVTLIGKVIDLQEKEKQIRRIKEEEEKGSD